VSLKFPVWLAGYYEDMNTLRGVYEGQDYASSTTYDNRLNSHFGNPNSISTMIGSARSNARFNFVATDRSNSPDHNEAPADWLTFNPYSLLPNFYEGRAQMVLPDSIGDIASGAFLAQPVRADYVRYASGHNTKDTYWSRANNNHDVDIAEAGSPQAKNISSYHQTNIAGVMTGETPRAGGAGPIYVPYAYLSHITSPSGQPFFIHRFNRRVDDWVEFASIANDGSGKKKYTIATAAHVNGEGLHSSDEWYIFNVQTVTKTSITVSFTSGATFVDIPNGDLDNLLPLDPGVAMTNPNTTTATAVHAIGIGSDTYYYKTLAAVSGGYRFTLDPARHGSGLTQNYTNPALQVFCDKQQLDQNQTDVLLYNQSSSGTPSGFRVLPTQGTSATSEPPLCNRLYIDDNSSSINMIRGPQFDVASSTTSSSTSGPSGTTGTYYIYTIKVRSGQLPSDVTIPKIGDNRADGNPFYNKAPLRDLNVNDYIQVKDSSGFLTTPEKITAISTGAHAMTITTDATYSATSTGFLRFSTYGSYVLSSGRPIDGLFGFESVMVGDVELNAQGSDGECFTIRMATQSFDNATGATPGHADPVYVLNVGYNRNDTDFDLNERGNMAGKLPAVSHKFRPKDGTGLPASRTRLFLEWNGTTNNNYTHDQIWFDIDVQFDFTNQKYQIFVDGTEVGAATPFNAKADGSNWAATDMYGWSLGVQVFDSFHEANSESLYLGYPASYNDPGTHSVFTLVERAGWCYRLTNRLIANDAAFAPNAPNADFLIDNLNLKSQVDSISSLEIEVHDDANELGMSALFSNAPDWSILLFRENDHRPIWKGLISDADFSQSSSQKTKDVRIRARDSLAEMEFQFPYFDLGQEESGPSLQSVYRQYEIASYSRAFDFGTSSLLNLNYTVGFDEEAKDSNDRYRARYDQRMRMFSAHPIQMYLNEDSNGPNFVEDNWEVSRKIDYIAPSGSTKTEIFMTSDGENDTTYADNADFTVGKEINIAGMWKNKGIPNTGARKSLPQLDEGGYLSVTHGGNSVATPHNDYLGAIAIDSTGTTANSFIIDKAWSRSLKLAKLENASGYLKMRLEPISSNRYEYMAGTTSQREQAIIARNPVLSSANGLEVVRFYVQPNAGAAGSYAAAANLPSEVYTSSAITFESTGTRDYAVEITTTKTVASLPSALQTALGSGAVGAALKDIGDVLETDLGFVHIKDSTSSYRNHHVRWMRDIPQSLWFQKIFGKIRRYPFGYTDTTGFSNCALTTLEANFNTGSDTTVTVADTSKFPTAGVCEIWTLNPYTLNLFGRTNARLLTSFVYNGKTAGSNRLDNVKFADTNQGIIASTVGEATNRYVVCRDISGDYKHIWVLWADMRNDGSADADGGTRKEDFGLIYPLKQNYKASMVWAATGQEFVDLKIGDEIDIWAVSADKDPATTTAWSDNPTALMIDYGQRGTNTIRLRGNRSDDTETITSYHNWENKAGAFIICDMSKFFNLNTEANNGRVGQDAGGLRTLDKLLVESEGFPMLIDNFWYQASANDETAGNPVPKDLNQYQWLTAQTTLQRDVVQTGIGAATLTQNLAASDTEMFVSTNAPFLSSGSVVINGDTIAYTGRGGSLASITLGSKGAGYPAAGGTWTTTGGGGSAGAGTYATEMEIASMAISNGGAGYGASKTGIWWADTGQATGTYTTNGSGVITAVAISGSGTRNDFYTSAPTITIDPPTGQTPTTNAVFTPTLATTGRLSTVAITNVGKGYDQSGGSMITAVWSGSPSTSANARFVNNSDQLTGVTGIATAHTSGDAVQSASTNTTMEVSDTSGFPAAMGANLFSAAGIAGKIEAVTTDAQGNESTTEYVFTYTAKTSTSFTGVKYRQIRSGEDIDTAALGVINNDAFTMSGVPTMNAAGTVIRSSLGSNFPMGFMLKLEGKIKTPNGGSFYEHDKIRIYQVSSLINDWFKQLIMPALSDFNNVPIMHDFNVDGNTSGAGTVESFGSVLDARGKSVLSTLRTVGASSGVGDGSSTITMNYMMGRDNRMELRPNYNAGHNFTRNNLKISDLKTGKSNTFTHIRVYYNGGQSFVDHPQQSYNSRNRVKVVNAIEVASYEQALAIAKREYQTRKDPAFSLECQVLRQSGASQRDGPMLADAKYGYIADPYVVQTGPYYGLNQHASGGGGTLAVGSSDAINHAFATQSVGYGVQVVHIPQGMPSVSETSGEELRIFIADAVASLPASTRLSDDAVDTKKFRIFLADYSFVNSASGGGSLAPLKKADQEGIEEITVKGNGFFEIAIPASYWSAGNAAGYKIVLSVNADYLNAVGRHAGGTNYGGNAFANQNSSYVSVSTGSLPTFTNVNTSSAFPLGIRDYSDRGDLYVFRSVLYAPRLRITDDVNYTVGTYVTYTDNRLALSNQVMFIQSVEYSYSAKSLDRTTLRLEKELNRIPSGIAGYLLPNVFDDRGAGGGGTGGGGGSGGSGGGGFPGGGLDGPGFPGGGLLPPPGFGPDGGYLGPQQGTYTGQGGIVGELGSVKTPSLGGNVQRLNRDTGEQQFGQLGAHTSPEMGSNNITKNMTNKINDTMRMDSLVPNAIQGLPGQKPPIKIDPRIRAIEGIDTKFLSSEGQASETADGWMLPGASQLDDSEATTNQVNSLSVQATLPTDVATPNVGVTATVSCDLGPASDKVVELTTTVTCPDTGDTLENVVEISVASSITRQQVALLPLMKFDAANTAGRSLQITITRKPDQGNDTADYSALTIHNIQVESKAHNNQGTATNQKVQAFTGTEQTTDDTDELNLDIRSDASPI